MSSLKTLGIATLLTAAVSTAAIADTFEAETINKDNTHNTANSAARNTTQVGVQAGAAAHNNTRVGVNANGGRAYANGGQAYANGGQGGAVEQEIGLNNQNNLHAEGGLGGQGGQGGQGGLGGQGGAAEQEQGQDQQQQANNEGQNNSQTSNYSSKYKAAAASAIANAPIAIPGSKCGAASSWGGGIQLVAGGGSLSHGESTPAGVQIRYTNDDGEEAVASLKSYATGTDIFKANVSENLSTPERATLICLEEEFNTREDKQQHDKEMRVINMHAYVVEKKADHLCRPKAKHYSGHDCEAMGDTSLDYLNQMIGFEPEVNPAVPTTTVGHAHTFK